MNEDIKKFTKGFVTVFNNNDGSVDVIITVNIEKFSNEYKIYSDFKNKIDYITAFIKKEINPSNLSSIEIIKGVEILKKFCGTKIYDDEEMYEPKQHIFMTVKFIDNKKFNHFKLINAELYSFWKTSQNFVHDTDEDEEYKNK